MTRLLTWKAMLAVLLLAVVSAPGRAVPAGEAVGDDGRLQHAEEVEAWRQQRLTSLQSPEGWLALVGLHWLEEGLTRVGRDAAADVRIPGDSGSEILFTLLRTGDEVRLESVAPGVSLSGAAAVPGPLAHDGGGDADVLRHGSLSFHLILRGDALGLRIRDEQAPRLQEFHGIDAFPLDARWNIDAHLEAYSPSRSVLVPTVLGTMQPMISPGALVFEWQGRGHRLDVFENEPGEPYFIIFADATNGEETYGGGRFLYAGPAVAGTLNVDFNRAYNPPCAFTPFATCPLPPQSNRLDLRVAAGEKVYVGDAHGPTVAAGDDNEDDAKQVLTTEHYRFLSRGGRTADMELVAGLETLWRFYEATVGSLIAMPQQPGRVEIVQFADADGLAHFVDGRTDLDHAYPGLPRSIAGGYLAIDAAGLAGSSDLASLFHVTVHLVHQRSLYQEGVEGHWWLREGLAVYFMQTRFDRNGAFRYGEIRTSEGYIMDVSGGRRVAHQLSFAEEPKKELRKIRSLYKKRRQIGIEELLDHPGDVPWPDATTRDRASLQSWAMVHFLLHGRDGELRDRFARYLEMEQRGEGGSIAFRRTVAGDLPAFEALLYGYIKKML